MSVREKMTAIADAIREKTGENKLLGLDAMAAAIAGIQTGAVIQRTSGSFSTDKQGKATVSCGFQPDGIIGAVSVYDERTYYFCFLFTEIPASEYPASIDAEDENGIINICANATELGFDVNVRAFDWSWNTDDMASQNRRFDYTAIKFT